MCVFNCCRFKSLLFRKIGKCLFLNYTLNFAIENDESPWFLKGFHTGLSYRPVIMAESKGFEPSKRFWRLHDFQSCSFDQLGQLSVSAIKCSYIIYDRAAKIKSFFKNPELFIFALPAYRINRGLRGINIICKSANFTCFLLYCIEPGDEI